MGKIENLKPFEPGQSGNPAGRPKGSRNLTTVLREMLEEEITVKVGDKEERRKFKEVIIRRLIKSANDGDVRAINSIFDRVDGKAKEFIELDIPNGVQSSSTHEVIFRDFTKPAERKKRKPRKK